MTIEIDNKWIFVLIAVLMYTAILCYNKDKELKECEKVEPSPGEKTETPTDKPPEGKTEEKIEFL